ncbi:Fibrinogen- and Ig-binding protein [Bienertia sinuspersici]
MSEERKMLEAEKKSLCHEKEMLLGDLAECRSVIASLKKENSGLNTSLAVMTEESKKLKDHEEFLAQEFERLSTELVVFQGKVSIQHQERVKLEAELKEAMSRLEQMAEENILLHSSLEIYKARVAETDSWQSQLSSVGTGSKSHIQTAATDSSMENSMKEDTEAALAFEAKVNTDDHEPEDSPLTLTESMELLDPHFVAKEQLSCLRYVLQALAQNAEHVDAVIKEESSRCKAAIGACGELLRLKLKL